MAHIVLGIAMSHSPQLSLPAANWAEYAVRDREFPLYYQRRTWTWDDLVQERARTAIDQQITEEAFAAKDARVQAGVAELARTMADVAPDLVVIVGDDHHELFTDQSMPTLAVYWGDSVESVPRSVESLYPPSRPAAWALYGEERETLRCDGELGRHLIEELHRSEFDVAQVSRQPDGVSIGHTYVIVRTRLMDRGLPPLPFVPVIINTYFPPNRPTPWRCYAFGRALRSAVESYPKDLRVAVVASGGLSHFIVDEAFDRGLLDSLARRDEAAIRAMSPDDFISGTSESLCWLALAGACGELPMDVVEYVPGYRTLAGTGCGMAMARWL